MDDVTVAEVLDGRTEDVNGLGWRYQGMVISWYLGVALLWLAAALTFVTGLDYFNKARPYLKD